MTKRQHERDDAAARAKRAAEQIDYMRSEKIKLTVAEMATVIREEIASLVADNRRLRAALSPVVEWWDWYLSLSPDKRGSIVRAFGELRFFDMDTIANKARAALVETAATRAATEKRDKP